jgi:AGCS family alanine or glycine:cation symporter
MMSPSKTVGRQDMSPFQAFLSTLNANLGNGSIAGMATALYAGGPGAAFWVVITGIVMASVRFCEVYLSTYFAAHAKDRQTLGGPMLYLRSVVGGKALSWLYGFSCFLFSLMVGNAIQANTVRLSLEHTWNIPMIPTAVVLTLFVLYVVLGGAQRVARLSQALVPLKIGVFLISSFGVLAYHYQALLPALALIMKHAFTPLAVAGGALGFGVQQAIRFGMSRSIMANESGLGTAAILYSATGSAEPIRDAIISMVSTFISILVCFLIMLSIVASGVWDSGLTSSALTIAAYQTAFGHYGAWIVTFLSVSFGIGVVVAFAYITRECWLFLSGGRYPHVVSGLYCITAFIGALLPVNAVWLLAEALNALMLIINLFGILCLLPLVRAGLKAFMQQETQAE